MRGINCQETVKLTTDAHSKLLARFELEAKLAQTSNDPNLHLGKKNVPKTEENRNIYHHDYEVETQPAPEE